MRREMNPRPTTKGVRAIGVILLSEYHASSIRLWRVILLRSDIRLAPSGIRFASFRANRIPLKPQGFNITIAVAIISLFAKAKNITKKAEKERASRNFVTALLSLMFLLQVSHLFYKCIGLRPYPYLISPLRTSRILFVLLFCVLLWKVSCVTPYRCTVGR